MLQEGGREEAVYWHSVTGYWLSKFANLQMKNFGVQGIDVMTVQ